MPTSVLEHGQPAHDRVRYRSAEAEGDAEIDAEGDADGPVRLSTLTTR